MQQRRILLGDEMGLGKTVEVLIALEALGAKKVLIVAPKSLLKNWEQEIQLWLAPKKGEIAVIKGSNKRVQASKIRLATGNPNTRYLITHYEAVETERKSKGKTDNGKETQSTPDIHALLNAWGVEYKIADEIHGIRNFTTLKARGFRKIKAAKGFVGLSGYILVNGLGDLLSGLHEVDPAMFPDPEKFDEKYAKDPQASLRLGTDVLSRVFLRRTKEDVAMDLPPRLPTEYVSVPMDPAQQARYEKIRDRNEEELRQDSSWNRNRYIRLLGVRELLEQIALDQGLYEHGRMKNKKITKARQKKMDKPSAKIRQAVRDIREALKKGESVFVSSRYNFVVQKIIRVLSRDKKMAKMISTINADQPIDKRHQEVRRFNQDPQKRIFVATRIAWEGLNGLEKASLGIVMEPPKTYAALEQFIGRLHRKRRPLHRKGEENPVRVRVYITPGTVDSENLRIILKKKKLFRRTINRRFGTQDEISVYQLLKNQAKKYNQEETMRWLLRYAYKTGDWASIGPAYDTAGESMAAYHFSRARYLHLIQLHKEGVIDLAGIKNWFFAPTGVGLDLLAMGSLAKEFAAIGINIWELNLKEADKEQIMLDLSRKKVTKKYALRSKQLPPMDLTEAVFEPNAEHYAENSELPYLSEFTNSKGINGAVWAAAQSVNSVDEGGLVCFWVHNGAFSEEEGKDTKHNFAAYLDLEPIDPQYDRLNVPQFSADDQAKVKRNAFFLGRKRSKKVLSEEEIAKIPSDAFSFEKEFRPTSRIAMKKIHYTGPPEEDNGFSSGDSMEAVEFTVQRLPRRVLRQERMTHDDARLKGLLEEIVRRLRGSPRKPAKPEEVADEINERVKAIIGLNPVKNPFVEKVLDQLEFYLAHRKNLNPEAREKFSAILQKMKNYSPVVEAHHGRTKNFSRRPTRRASREQEATLVPTISNGKHKSGQKPKPQPLPEKFMDYPHRPDVFEERGTVLKGFLRPQGVSFWISPDPVREIVYYDAASKRLYVDPVFLKAKLSSADLAILTDLRAYDVIPNFFPPAQQEAARQAARELQLERFRSRKDEDYDLRILEQAGLDPDETDLFDFLLDLRRAGTARDPARSEARAVESRSQSPAAQAEVAAMMAQLRSQVVEPSMAVAVEKGKKLRVIHKEDLIPAAAKRFEIPTESHLLLESNILKQSDILLAHPEAPKLILKAAEGNENQILVSYVDENRTESAGVLDLNHPITSLMRIGGIALQVLEDKKLAVSYRPHPEKSTTAQFQDRKAVIDEIYLKLKKAERFTVPVSSHFILESSLFLNQDVLLDRGYSQDGYLLLTRERERQGRGQSNRIAVYRFSGMKRLYPEDRGNPVSFLHPSRPYTSLAEVSGIALQVLPDGKITASQWPEKVRLVQRSRSELRTSRKGSEKAERREVEEIKQALQRESESNSSGPQLMSQPRRVNSFFEKLKRISRFLRMLSPRSPATELLGGRLRQAISAFLNSNPRNVTRGIMTVGTYSIPLAAMISTHLLGLEGSQSRARAISAGMVETLAPVSTAIGILRSLARLRKVTSRMTMFAARSISKGIVAVLENNGIILGQFFDGAIYQNRAFVIQGGTEDRVAVRGMGQQSSLNRRGGFGVDLRDLNQKPFRPFAETIPDFFERFDFFGRHRLSRVPRVKDYSTHLQLGQDFQNTPRFEGGRHKWYRYKSRSEARAAESRSQNPAAQVEVAAMMAQLRPQVVETGAKEGPRRNEAEDPGIKQLDDFLKRHELAGIENPQTFGRLLRKKVLGEEAVFQEARRLLRGILAKALIPPEVRGASQAWLYALTPEYAAALPWDKKIDAAEVDRELERERKIEAFVAAMKEKLKKETTKEIYHNLLEPIKLARMDYKVEIGIARMAAILSRLESRPILPDYSKQILLNDFLGRLFSQFPRLNRSNFEPGDLAVDIVRDESARYEEGRRVSMIRIIRKKDGIVIANLRNGFAGDDLDGDWGLRWVRQRVFEFQKSNVSYLIGQDLLYTAQGHHTAQTRFANEYLKAELTPEGKGVIVGMEAFERKRMRILPAGSERIHGGVIVRNYHNPSAQNVFLRRFASNPRFIFFFPYYKDTPGQFERPLYVIDLAFPIPVVMDSVRYEVLPDGRFQITPLDFQKNEAYRIYHAHFVQESGKSGEDAPPADELTGKPEKAKPAADGELETIRGLIGGRFPMWMKHPDSSPDFPRLARGVLLRRDDPPRFWDEIHGRFNAAATPPELRRLIQSAYAAAVPLLRDKIFSGQMDEDELRQEFDNEYELMLFEEHVINHPDWNGLYEDDLTALADYARKWSGYPIRTDEVRMASMLARSRTKLEFNPQSKDKLIQDFLSRHGKIFGNRLQRKDLEIDLSRPGKILIISARSPLLIYAELGPDYEGKLQGHWYIDWTNIRFTREVLSTPSTSYRYLVKKTKPIRFRAFKMPQDSAVVLELRGYPRKTGKGWVVVRNPYDRDKSLLIFKVHRHNYRTSIWDALFERDNFPHSLLFPDAYLDLTLPGNKAEVDGMVFEVTGKGTIKVFQAPDHESESVPKSELRTAGTVPPVPGLPRETLVTLQGPRELLFPARLKPEERLQLKALFFGQDVERSEIRRVLVDFRPRLPRDPSEVDALVSYTLSHPEVTYHLSLMANAGEVNRFRSEVRNYIQSRRARAMPENFRIQAVADWDSFKTDMNRVFDRAPYGRRAYLTADPRYVLNFRSGLLQSVGSNNARLQAAAGLLILERLRDGLPPEIYFQIHPAQDLDEAGLLSKILADLNRGTFLSASA